VMGAGPEDESFAVGVEQLQIAKRCRDLVRDNDVVGGLDDRSCRRRRSNGESSQLLITPVSSQTPHCHRIGVPGLVRSTIIRPGQARLAGRRRHGSALSQTVPASPAVAARTMLPRCSASRRAGPGVSGGRSSKWCSSVTNIPGIVSTQLGVALLVAAVSRWRALCGRGRAG
jgi:hypothetical protein